MTVDLIPNNLSCFVMNRNILLPIKYTLQQHGGTITLEQVFEKVVNFGSHVRKNRLDGLQKWNVLKKILNDVTGLSDSCNWRISCKLDSDEPVTDIEQIYHFVHDELGMKGDDTDDESSPFWEAHHFALQLIRIPRNNPKVSLQRLLQVAYNIGQFKVEVEKGSYSMDVINFVKNNRLDSMDSYINVEGVGPTNINMSDLDQLM
jgi:hypothetical protein